MSDESNEEKGTEREEKKENTKPILGIKKVMATEPAGRTCPCVKHF